MKLKDYCLICLLILTAVSGILYWTSTLEIVSVVTLVQYPSFLDETDIGEMEIATRVHFVVYFDLEATCWAEKPHEVEYDDFELCRVKVIRHLFGDGDIPTASKHQQNILVFSNTTTQNVFRLLFLILLTLNSINFLRRNQSNE